MIDFLSEFDHNLSGLSWNNSRCYISREA